MPNETMRVRAVGDRRLPTVGRSGAFVGRRGADHAIIEEGVTVPDDSYHRRAVTRGDLVEVVASPVEEVQS